MGEWKILKDILKAIPEKKWPALSKLRLPVRYTSRWKRIVGDQEGRVGKIYKWQNFIFLIGLKRKIANANDCEVFIDEKAERRLFIWALTDDK